MIHGNSNYSSQGAFYSFQLAQASVYCTMVFPQQNEGNTEEISGAFMDVQCLSLQSHLVELEPDGHTFPVPTMSLPSIQTFQPYINDGKKEYMMYLKLCKQPWLMERGRRKYAKELQDYIKHQEYEIHLGVAHFCN